MRLEDLKTKKISDLRGLLVDEAPLVKADTPLSQAASSITKSVSRMAVGVDDKDNVVGVLTGSDVARTVQQRSINPTDLTSTVINRDYVGEMSLTRFRS